jgi:hypothetical protein
MSEENKLMTNEGSDEILFNIKDKIKETIFASIPDEKWEALIKDEVKSFFEENVNFSVVRKPYSYGNPEQTKIEFDKESSIFGHLVREECIKLTEEYFKSEVVSKYFSDMLNVNSEDNKSRMDGLVEEVIPLAINRYFTNIASNMMHQLRHDINRNMHG